jgi:V/A-type H+/Na+-transporting ATPase subunit I
MIVKMKKVTILTTEKTAGSAVGQLRKLGVVHIKHAQIPHADQITALGHKIENISEAIGLLKNVAGQIKVEEKSELVNYEKQVLSLGKERVTIQQEIEEYEKKLGWFNRWLAISEEEAAALAAKGVFLTFYLCSKGDLKKIPKNKIFYIVKRFGAQLVVVMISRQKEDALAFKRLELPGRSRHYVQKHLGHLRCCRESIDVKLSGLSIYRESFLDYKNRLIKQAEFAKVRFGMAHKETIAWLEGYVPVSAESDLKRLTAECGWALVSQEPENPQDVPTLIKTPAWVGIIRPVFNFMGTLPGYKEYDISFWFLLFFSVFFAMLIGDAGYGLLFMAATVAARKKLKDAPGNVFSLLYVLSAATIIWGALSGTWFGCQAIAQMPFLSSLVVERVNSFIDVNQEFMMYACFVIGIVHMSIARAIVAFRYGNSGQALGQVGWIAVLWALFFMIGKVVLDKPLPGFMLPLAGSGALLILLFSSSHKNIAVRVGLSLANLPLKVINSFADILSYLRLFVIGYVSVMVASSFNDMALEIGFNSFFSGLAAAAILFFGHSLNIVLGLLSVLVHGIRLNMLEFSGHLGMEWAGVAYKPFKE